MKTKEQIESEIKALREMKPSVRHRTMFGDDNHAAIDAQIKVLEEGMSEDAIYDEWPEDEEDAHERDHARDAATWRDSDDPEDGAPSVGWKELVQPVSEKGAANQD